MRIQLSVLLLLLSSIACGKKPPLDSSAVASSNSTPPDAALGSSASAVTAARTAGGLEASGANSNGSAVAATDAASEPAVSGVAPNTTSKPDPAGSSASAIASNTGKKPDPAPSSTASTVVMPPATSELAFNVAFAGLLDGTSTDWEQARDVAFDKQGAMYVVGGTTSPDFPITTGAYNTSYSSGGSALGGRGPSDAFVTKIDAAGKIVWSTYLGGPNYERAYAVEVDEKGEVYVAGRAGPGFPTTAGALQETFAGDSEADAYGQQDGFVVKLSADGSSVIWSTYFGDSGTGFIRDIDIDAEHRVHLAASTISGSDLEKYIKPGAAQSAKRGNYDSFYARLSADGKSVENATYLGGNDTGGSFSSNPSVRVFRDGSVYVLSDDPGDGAPTTAGAYQRNSSGLLEYLLAKFDPTGKLAFCTYLGGSGDEAMDTHSLVLDQEGNAIIGGTSDSKDFPTTDGSKLSGAIDFTLSKLSSDGSKLLASRIWGGTGKDVLEGIGIDAQGNVYVTGNSESADLMVTSKALSAAHLANSREGTLAVFSSDLKQRRYQSYDGIPGEYGDRSSIVTSAGVWGVVGSVWKLPKFPATPGQDATIDGTHGAFFMRLDPR